MNEARYLLGSWLVLGAVGLGLLSGFVANLFLVETGPGDLVVEALDGIVRTLLVVSPLLALVLAITLRASFLSPELRREDHLVGCAPRRRSVRSAIAATLIMVGTQLGAVLLGLAFAWGVAQMNEISGVMGTSSGAGSPVAAVLALTVLPVGWALIMLGLTHVASVRVGLALCAAAVAVGWVLGLLARRYASLQPLHDVSPAGSARTLVAEEVFGGSSAGGRRWVSGAVFLAWAALGAAVLLRRGHAETYSSAGGAGGGRLDVARLRPPASRLVGSVSLAVAVAAGVLLPQRLADAVPWRLKAEWRAAVSQGLTPADQAVALLARIDGRSRDQASRVVGVRLTTMQYRQLVRAARGEQPRNDLDESIPGTVVVDLGAERTNAAGEIELAEQVALCFVKKGSTWRLTDVPWNNSCETGGR